MGSVFVCYTKSPTQLLRIRIEKHLYMYVLFGQVSCMDQSMTVFSEGAETETMHGRLLRGDNAHIY